MTIAIIGAGAWGSAMAAHLARLHSCENHVDEKIMLWSRSGALPASLQSYDNKIIATQGLAVAADSDIVILATPAQSVRDILQVLKTHLRSDAVLLCAAKGIDQTSGLLLSDVAYSAVPNPFLILSGPSFADEVARGLPTALTVAGTNSEATEKIVQQLASPHFRLYKSDDIIGVQLGGAVKNVIAIACGIAMGAGLGENARAALMTRGLAEIMRLATACGAKRDTLMGLSGLGDLALTCASAKSRNFSYGFAIGSGVSAVNASGTAKGVVEGAFTASAVLKLAQSYGIELPICEAVDAIVRNSISVADAMNALLLRPLKSEN